MNFAELSIVNPRRKKQVQSAWNQFFPYYAGYPDSFARSILLSAQLDPRAVILDPWNGSGTTTYVASQLRFSAIGMDLNPVMVVVARSRLLPGSEADALQPLAAEILRRADKIPTQCTETDPLTRWFERETAGCLRGIELSIRAILLGDLTLTSHGANFECISSIAATFYVALFNVAKTLAAPFQSSNPTWLRNPKHGEPRSWLPKTEIGEKFQAHIKRMSDALHSEANLFAKNPAFATMRLFDSTSVFDFERNVDFVLTSPPYCTRIDYTAATRIQLAILEPLLQFSIDDLSRRLIGSIKVPKENVQIRSEWGERCNDFLHKIKVHESHASKNYYLKTHVDYFDKLDRSVSNISRSLKDGRAAVLVVRNSHYKELHNDVPSITTDIAERHGLKLKRRVDFEVKISMSDINPRARTYRKHSKIVESVLCLQKTY